MVISTGAFSEDLWPGIMKWFGDSYEDWEPLWEKIADKHDSNKAFEKFQGITNYGLAGVKDQGSGIPYRDKFQGYNREIINTSYGIGSTITYEMMRYDQYDKFQSIPQQLAKSVRKTEETVVFNLLNNGFSTATNPTLTADGLSLLNSAHRLVAANNVTQRNTPATASDLNQSSLEQMYIDVSNFVDDQNLPIVVKPMRLIVPTASQHIARKILGTEYEVGSGNNTINPVSSARMPLDLVVSPWLTDTDAWFVKTDEADGLVFTDVDPVMLDRDNDFDTKNLKFSAMRLFGVGAVNYLGYYGSPGA
jgi:phage major head subunit gpT-like protein